MLRHMMKLFSGLDRAYGVFSVNGIKIANQKRKGKATTIIAELTWHVWKDHLRGVRGVGIVPITDEAVVQWAAIDIDIYDLDYIMLEEKIKNLGFPLVMCKTKSGGVHLYLFLEKPVSAAYIRGILSSWSAKLGYGGVEIFPKQVQLSSKNDTGNWLNMPYFDYKGWSKGSQTDRPCLIKGRPLTLPQFLIFAESKRTSEDQLALLENMVVRQDLKDGPPCLQVLSITGVPQGQRKVSLLNFAVLAKKSKGDDWEMAVTKFNEELMQPPLPVQEVLSVINSLNKKDYFYTCNSEPLVNYCDKVRCKKCKYGIGDSLDVEFRRVKISGVTKILTDPVIWIFNIDGFSVELSTEDIYSQNRFRRICVEQLNKLPTQLKSVKYEQMIQDAIDNREEVVAPYDSTQEGQFMFHLNTFLTDRPMSVTRDELLMGKPWCEEGRIYFRSTDLMEYLEQKRFYGFAGNRIFTVLRKLKFQHKQFSIKSKCVQTWSVEDTFSRQLEEFSPVKIVENF